MRRTLTAIITVMLAITLLCGMAVAEDKPILSGKHKTHKDAANGYKVEVPVEFKQTIKSGPTIQWQGPTVDGGSLSMSVNTVVMSVPSKTLYDINFKQTKKNKRYAKVVAIPMKGPGEVYAYAFQETDKNSDGSDKKPGDIHRWHIRAFGNGRYYTWGFAGPYKTMNKKNVQDVYKAVMKSVELISVK